jgi:phosphate transport system substrate-binding protein
MKCLKVSRKILAIALIIGVSATASAQLMINGAGATFPYPIYSKWFDAYTKVDSSVRFNYQSIGSGGGQKQILAQTVDFGASDGPMSDDNLAKAPGKILHIPTVAGADVIAYNLPGNPALKFDADTIAAIFLGHIKKWNDPKITVLNPGVSLPDKEIIVVHRSDGSGTTFIFTDYLSKISPEWKSKVGANTSVNWPTGIGGKGNEGVAGQIKQTPGAVGYVELIYAVQNKMPYAEVKNAAGEFVKPNRSPPRWRRRIFRTTSVSRSQTRRARMRTQSPARPGCWFTSDRKMRTKERSWWNF